ncbi:transglutaminase-like domain-containing protein [Hoeflea prorocentri]|uniref:Transglutaminase family protein n=1 Tax=Hoeflea prorocentri TaxID=1922333 RepID=A0A9X3UG83_9HYPH|nr:transglutaminase family protein [Hoeflea prorocentri]MCY6380167.1 transglutaminase family protein [Hoeflea prorocentri]MDA5397967.1 transglutaminase family protein [Hoeflea prorocentri]
MTDTSDHRPPERADCLQAGLYVDSGSDAVRRFTLDALESAKATTDTQKAVALYNAVRDGFRYNPYSISMRAEDYKASHIVKTQSAYCVPKAILLTACLRAAGIPAAVGFADVRNHLNSPKLAELMGSDLFIYHGYVQLWLGDSTFKVTPAFNSEMCERFGVKPLDFDGTADALFHEYDADNRRHMEYVNDRGIYQDPPIVEILSTFKAFYPRLAEFAAGASRQGQEPVDAAFLGNG